MTRQEELEKAAEEYANPCEFDKEKLGVVGFQINAVKKDFKAGADWEHERSKVLVEALNNFLRTMKLINEYQGCPFSQPLIRIEEALKQYNGGEG